MDKLIIENTPTYRSSENTGQGAYAVFNPSTAEFSRIVKKSNRSILEIGCGSPPRCSWDISGLWVGCDPALPSESNSKTLIPVQAGKQHIKTDMVVFSDIVAEVPEFKPDVLCAVAPNQKHITDGKIFNDELEKFLKSRGQQLFVIVLDTRTHEALGYQQDAIVTIGDWMQENRFKRTDPNEHPILSSFHPNSRDLGGNNIRLVFAR